MSIETYKAFLEEQRNSIINSQNTLMKKFSNTLEFKTIENKAPAYFNHYLNNYHKTLEDTVVLKLSKDFDLNCLNIGEDSFSMNIFKDLKLPFDDIYIDMEKNTIPTECESIGIHLYKDSSYEDNLYINVYVQYDNIKESARIPCVINSDKLPRFYLLCPEMQNHKGETCSNFVSGGSFDSILNGFLCLKTPRSSSRCILSKCAYLGIKLAGSIVEYINKRPQYIEAAETYNEISSGDNKKSKQSSHREIVIRKTISVSSNETFEKRTHKSPVPHPRRGFYRHYKNKEEPVWVNKTFVNKKDNNETFSYVIK